MLIKFLFQSHPEDRKIIMDARLEWAIDPDDLSRMDWEGNFISNARTIELVGEVIRSEWTRFWNAAVHSINWGIKGIVSYDSLQSIVKYNLKKNLNNIVKTHHKQ